MDLTTLDWLIVASYFLLILAIGFYFRNRAGKSVEEFFVSGRSLPWWIAGTSMVATTFAADTPLAVTSLIVKNGLAGNWFWWAFAAGGMVTVFVYARMWRRAEVLTDVELVQLRYSGTASRALRYTRAVYIALVVNPIIIGWVIGAMLLVLRETIFFDAPADAATSFWNRDVLAWAAVIAMMGVVGVYSTMSGMWGVAVSDAIQFFLAMGGCLWLAVVAVNHVGGVESLRQEVKSQFGDEQAFQYLPALGSVKLNQGDDSATDGSKLAEVQSVLRQAEQRLAESSSTSSLHPLLETRTETLRDLLAGIEGNPPSDEAASVATELESILDKSQPGPWMAFHVFLIMLTMQWWAVWYPGAEPGGGGYVVQRMASCKDERHSMLATLWYQIAHYCIRPWPWIMISFVALAMFPELRLNYLTDPDFNPGVGFPMVMRQLCPPGLAGLMLVAFMAAFMSTISTQLNWGASYLVRDFISPLWLGANADPHREASLSRIVTVALLLVGILFGYQMQSIDVDVAWKMLAALGAGTGLVFMLRWFWWRINAWSEIVAMLGSLVFYLLFSFTNISQWLFQTTLRDEEQMAVIAIATIATWLIATWLTPPESEHQLRNFFVKIRPGGPGWKPIAQLEPDVAQDPYLAISLLGAALAAGLVYLTLPAIGYVIFGQWSWAIGCLAGAAGCAIGVALITRKLTQPH